MNEQFIELVIDTTTLTREGLMCWLKTADGFK